MLPMISLRCARVDSACLINNEERLSQSAKRRPRMRRMAARTSMKKTVDILEVLMDRTHEMYTQRPSYQRMAQEAR